MGRIYYHPRDYQRIITDHILDTPRNGVWAGMGLGKTVATLTALDALFLSGYEKKPALVLAPLRVAQNTWPDEAAKWHQLRNIEVQPIIGDEGTRRAALRNPNASVFTINYENLAWLLEVLNGHWPFGKIISDESTKLKGFRLKQGTQRAAALAKVAFNGKRFTELTGTPSPNGLQDLWGQIWYLDAGERLGRTHDGFKNRWFQRSFTGFGLAPLPFAQKEIEAKLKDICISLDAKDYFDISEPIESIRYVELPKKAREKYNDMQKEMFMELGQYKVEAFNAASRTQKCLQLANGAAYVEDDVVDVDAPKALKWYDVHDQKLQALDEIFEEAAGMPVMVAYNFKSDLARLKKAFPRGRAMDKNPQTIKDWNSGKIPYLWIHPASAGHGLNLQDGGNILAFFGVNWNLEYDQQIKERIGPVRQFQAGHNRPVFIYRIIARNTVDEMVMERLQTKKAVQDILLEAMKKHGF